MANCANCESPAQYVYQVSADYSINYCQRHLPRFLYTIRDNGGLGKPEVVVASEEPKAKKKAADPVVTPDAAS